MLIDRLLIGERLPVMHEPEAIAQPPERRRAKFVRSALRVVLGPDVLNDPVAGSDVMQQKVAERMKLFVPQPLAHDGVRAANWRSGGSGFQGSNVAQRATDFIEDFGTCLRSLRCAPHRFVRY